MVVGCTDNVGSKVGLCEYVGAIEGVSVGASDGSSLGAMLNEGADVLGSTVGSNDIDGLIVG